MEKNYDQGRIEWIDIAKGMLIILVVYTHAGLNNLGIIASWINGFMLPAFFFISGFLFSIDKFSGIKSFIQKRYYTLIRPYIIFTIICLIGYFILSPYEIKEKIITVITKGWGGIALWFIPVLLGAEILFFFIKKYISQISYQLLTLFILAAIGYLLYFYKTPNPYNVNFILTSTLFYGIGNISKNKIVNLMNTSNHMKLAVFLISSFIFSLSILLTKSNSHYFVNDLSGNLCTYISAISGSFMMCLLAKICSDIFPKFINLILIHLGRNTYIILALHQIILILLGHFIPDAPGFILRIIMWGILILSIIIINKYFPFILRKTQKKATITT